MKKKESGFTLIELMIVVAIIGILAAIALPKFADMLEKSREGATRGNLNSLQSAENIYQADQQGSYPVILTDTHTTGNSDVNFVLKYIPAIPPVKVTGKAEWNTSASQNHGPGSIAAAAVSVTTGNWASPAFAIGPGPAGWKYDSSYGSIWVNSNMVDMFNNVYTTYGY